MNRRTSFTEWCRFNTRRSQAIQARKSRTSLAEWCRFYKKDAIANFKAIWSHFLYGMVPFQLFKMEAKCTLMGVALPSRNDAVSTGLLEEKETHAVALPSRNDAVSTCLGD